MQAIRHGTMLLRPVSQLNTWPVVSPVNASRRPSRDAAHREQARGGRVDDRAAEAA